MEQIYVATEEADNEVEFYEEEAELLVNETEDADDNEEELSNR